MTETLEPNVFQMKLHVDPVDIEDETDLPLTTRSWRAQLWRLLHKAPQPIPVLCQEPKCFPHFEDGRKVSESSWTSNLTNSTNVSMSDSSLVNDATTTNLEGANEQSSDVAITEGDSSFLKTASVSQNESKDFTSTTTAKTSVSFDVINESCKNESDGGMGRKFSNCLSSCRPDKAGDKVQQGHRLPNSLNRPENTTIGNRKPVSLSIQGDSEYWEKFRYSKDYQSSLMIETICNEVFNLKPGSRYNNLMILSGTHGDSIQSNEQETEMSLVCNKDNEKWRIKVKTLETSSNEGGTKRISGSLPVPSLKIPSEIREETVTSNGKVGDIISIFERESRAKNSSQKDYGDINTECDFNDGNIVGKVAKKQWSSEREKRRNSTTSSVFTATTLTSNEGALESDRRQAERKLLLESFGQAFHGYLTKRETEKLLKNEGQYLIRQMWSEEGFVLSFMFDRTVWNYRLLYDTSKETEDSDSTGMNGSSIVFYLEDRRKCYKSLEEMVREGLITLHLDEHAGSYIDLLMELAQFQRNDSLLQTPNAVTSGSRKNSRSPSFRTKLVSSSSVSGSGEERTCGGSGVGLEDGVSGSPTADSSSTDIALFIHYFEEEVFDSLAKCHACTNGIWGTSYKGLRCRDCRLTVHESCIDNVKTRCNPDLTMLSPFSTDLTSLVKGSLVNGRNESHAPPYILHTCINEVEARGLTTEGIYRICGSVEEIEKLKNLFEKDKVNTTFSNQQVDIHAVTGLIKLFLRQLPDALITQEAFDDFLQEKRSGEMKIDAVQALVSSLPPGHRITLKYLLQHLQRIASKKEANKMNAYNLSSVLLPSLLVLSFDVIEVGTKLVHFLITHVEEIF